MMDKTLHAIACTECGSEIRWHGYSVEPPACRACGAHLTDDEISRLIAPGFERELWNREKARSASERNKPAAKTPTARRAPKPAEEAAKATS